MPASRSARCSTIASERAMGGVLSRIDQSSTPSVTIEAYVLEALD
jgi:hypothetical protein